jgi:hypothetical protein
MADIETIRSETERLVSVANSRLILSVERSERRVLKAEWEEDFHGYCLTLECAHTKVITERYLCSPILCLECVKEKLL